MQKLKLRYEFKSWLYMLVVIQKKCGAIMKDVSCELECGKEKKKSNL